MDISRAFRRLAAATALILATTVVNAQSAPLNLKVYHADADSFNVNAVLVTGENAGYRLYPSRCTAYRCNGLG